MLFALVKAYESNKKFDISFKYYEDVNWLHRKTLDYNAQLNSESKDKNILSYNNNNK